MHASDSGNKALIFTQFNDTLEFVAKQLQQNGFTCRCISGKMPMKQRAAAIEAFQSDPPTTVFVLSVRAAAVGITLTSANYIFMVEPLLNTALDDQAVGRAWRMGQTRPVTVKRLYIKGSVEEAIMTVAKDRQVRTHPRLLRCWPCCVEEKNRFYGPKVHGWELLDKWSWCRRLASCQWLARSKMLVHSPQISLR